MSVTGLCQICEAAEATHDCNRCGRLVCDDHWSRENSLCVQCVAEIGGETDERTPAGPGAEDVTPPDTDDTTHQL